jgi:Gpi18-like mannosyltransferase
MSYRNAFFLIIAIVLISSVLLYIPFILNLFQYLGFVGLKTSMLTVYQNYDGPLYIVPAKTWYIPKAIENLRLEQGLPSNYFAAHLPLYPVLISIGAPILGYLRSMIGVSLISACALAVFFFFFIKKFKITEQPLLLTVVLLFLPRFLIVRSVGSPESLFLLLVLASVYFFERKNYLLAGLVGGLSIWAKSPGILLFPAYGLVILETLYRERKFRFGWLYLLFIPAGLVTLFLFYARQYGDFWAYFNSGDNLHLVAPFSVFNFQKRWVDTAWLEEIVLYFILYLYSIINLKDSKYRSFFYFPLVFFAASIQLLQLTQQLRP